MVLVRFMVLGLMRTTKRSVAVASSSSTISSVNLCSVFTRSAVVSMTVPAFGSTWKAVVPTK